MQPLSCRMNENSVHVTLWGLYHYLYLLTLFHTFTYTYTEIVYVKKDSLDFEKTYCSSKEADDIWDSSEDGKNWKICNMKSDCSLLFQPVATKPAHQIMINITAETDSQISKNNLTLLIYKDSSEFKEYLIPGTPFNSSSKRFTVNLKYDLDNVKDANNIQLLFNSAQFCGSIDKITVYYYQCPSASDELVYYDERPAPGKSETENGYVRLNGNCVKNSQLDSLNEPYMKCFYNNTMEFHGHCICNEGYTNEPKQCRRCNTVEYKPNKGNTPCLKCGANSTSIDDQLRKKCVCKPTFHRIIGKEEDSAAECFESPSEPRNVSVTNIKADEATLIWKAPARSGSLPLGLYFIRCTNCPSDYNVPFINTTTNETIYKIGGLGAYAHYMIEITNENEITSNTGSKNSAKTNFTTAEGDPGMIRGVKVLARSDGTVMISWNPPFDRGAENLIYVINYGEKTEIRKSTSFEIHPSSQDKTYMVTIRTKATSQDGIEFMGKPFRKEVKVKGGVPLTLYLIITFSVFIIIVAALIAAFCVWKRRNPAYLQVVRMEDGSVKLPTRFYTGGSLYVDPKSYADVDDAINDFAYEIDRSDLTTGAKIGTGEFADVFQGTLNRSGKKVDVAVKTLKPDATKSDRDDFLSEAVILGQFNDPNVIRLEGVVYQDEPNAIILEYMVNGSLDKFLQDHDMQFTVEELLEMGRGVASGMKCLSEMGFVHRDLAARNILVNDERQCKIADFGMSLEIKIDDSTEEKVGKVPVRWTAPEAIQFKKFTTASDVWSYGVVLWEIMSYGERPYWDWSNLDVLEKVTSGYRLPPPMGCPRVVHDLMLTCWNKERAKRPLFSSIRNTIFSWLRDPKSLEDIAQSIQLDPNLDYTIMQTINKWLETIGMGRYTPNFLEQGFATPRQILLLTMSDIEALGVGPEEHQKKIYKAIERTRNQVEHQIKRSNSNVHNNPYAK